MNIGFSFVSLNSSVQQKDIDKVETTGSIALFTPAANAETTGSIASASGSSFSCMA